MGAVLARFVADPPTVTMQRIKALLTGGARITHVKEISSVPLPCVPALSLHSRMQVCQHLLTCRGASQLVKSRRTTWLISSDAEEGVWYAKTLFALFKICMCCCVGKCLMVLENLITEGMKSTLRAGLHGRQHLAAAVPLGICAGAALPLLQRARPPHCRRWRLGGARLPPHSSVTYQRGLLICRSRVRAVW